jgi:hypothetical protein
VFVAVLLLYGTHCFAPRQRCHATLSSNGSNVRSSPRYAPEEPRVIIIIVVGWFSYAVHPSFVFRRGGFEDLDGQSGTPELKVRSRNRYASRSELQLQRLQQ